MRAGAAERAIEVERHARQVAEVLEQREEREEDGHGRQHHADHPGGREVHPVDQQPAAISSIANAQLRRGSC